MKYTSPSFTLPAGSNKISQAEWDRIFKKQSRKSKKKGKK